MRYLVTETGRKLHVVREIAWKGHDGKFLFGLCGVWPKIVAGDPCVVSSPPAPGVADLCKTCQRLA